MTTAKRKTKATPKKARSRALTDGDKFRAIIEDIKKSAEQLDQERHKRLDGAYDFYRRTGRGERLLTLYSGPSTEAERLRKHASALRSYLPYVDAGLMSPADVIREVNQGKTAAAIAGAGAAIAGATKRIAKAIDRPRKDGLREQADEDQDFAEEFGEEALDDVRNGHRFNRRDD